MKNTTKILTIKCPEVLIFLLNCSKHSKLFKNSVHYLGVGVVRRIGMCASLVKIFF